jgi:PAS domain S-box-containing protein
MFQNLAAFFNSEDFMPHGHCFLWRSDILWLHVISDTGIALAYFSIPLVLLYFVRKRKDLPFPKVFLLFGTFIFLCGLTHLMGIWVIWHPNYALDGTIKAMTAIASIITLFVTVKLIPQALYLVSPARFARLNQELQDTNLKLVNLYEQTRQGSEVRLRAVVDHAIDGVITISERGIVESFNPACERIFGYSAKEVIGQNIKMLMPDPYHGEHDSYLSNYKKTAVAKIIGIGREVRGKRKDHTTFPMDLAVSSFELEDGRHFSGIIRDISERKEAEKAHEQLRQAQKMDALGQLTGGIAHDFNNLLAVILGNLDFLYERTNDDDPLREFIKPSIEAAEHGSELTQRLLAFGRKQSLQPRIVSLNDLIDKFLTLIRRTLGERIEIITRFADDLWNVNVDPGHFSDVLLNLSVNARDAMPDGGKIIYETQNVILDGEYAEHHIDVTPGEYAMIAVSDTGTGMTSEIIEKAFDPFFTTKGVGKGSGLGLSMVYGFVKQSAGHIKLYSEPGHGTSVKIYLPKSAGPLSSTSPKESNPAICDKNKSRVIMIVEDNKNVLKLTSAMVKSLGYDVIIAETGDAAIKIFESDTLIDLLLTDVMLPGTLNGPGLAKRAVELRPGLKVLFNSGYAEHAIVQSGILEEGVHLISKPFRKQQLARKLAELLG